MGGEEREELEEEKEEQKREEGKDEEEYVEEEGKEGEEEKQEEEDEDGDGRRCFLAKCHSRRDFSCCRLRYLYSSLGRPWDVGEVEW